MNEAIPESRPARTESSPSTVPDAAALVRTALRHARGAAWLVRAGEPGLARFELALLVEELREELSGGDAA